MIDISKNLELASNSAFPATTAYKLGNVIDLGKTGRDIGNGGDLYLVIKSGTTALTGTTTALSVDLVSTDTEPTTTFTTPTVHLTGAVIPTIAALAGGSFVVGRTYKIVSVGTTDFTLIGASANTVGVVFTATGAGSGTGTASDVLTLASTIWQVVELPRGVYKRYLALRANFATAALSTGTLDAFLVKDPNGYIAYNQGVIGA